MPQGVAQLENLSVEYKRRWWTLGTIAFSLIIFGLDNMVLQVAIPTLQRELNATSSQLIWMIDAYIVVFASLLLVSGTLGDRYGRKLVMQLGLAVFCISSLTAAYAGSATQLIIVRGIMGICAAMVVTSSLSIITNVFPREERGQAIGIWAGVNVLGIALGPVIGGLLLEHYWWGSVFLINLPVVLITLPLGIVLLPESHHPNPSPLDVVGLVLSTAAVSTLVFGLIEAPGKGWTNARVLGSLAFAVPLAAGFFLYELRTPHPMLKLSFFKNLRFSGGVIATALASFSLFGVMFAVTQYLQFVQGYTPLQAGIRMLPLSLGILIGAGNADRLVKLLGSNRVVAIGLLLLSVALMGCTLWTPDTTFWIVGSILFLAALAMGNIMAPSADAIMGGVSETEAGIGAGMAGVSRMVAGALGAAVTGSVLYTVYGNQLNSSVVGLPAEALEAAKDSIGVAMHIATTLPSDMGAILIQEASVAFMDAIGWSVLIGACIALLASVLVLKIMPPRHLPFEDRT